MMTDPIASIVINALATAAIKKTSDGLVEKIFLRTAKKNIESTNLPLTEGLPNYLVANYAKCETLKTLLNRNDPMPLADCFVAPDFKLKEETNPSSDFLNKMNEARGKIVITGLAGSGKSVFLKYTFRKVINEGYSFYPIYFELRSLNRIPQKKGIMMSHIYNSIKSCCEDFTKAQFNHGLKRGAFYFLLDGFDELNQELREQVSTEVKTLANNYRECVILVTSRPSDEFVSWEGFSEAKLMPFDIDKAVEYISKLKFDEEKKTDFIKDLRDGLFERNKEFLSNPLLSAMMLLTYDSFGEIPEKKHIFYSKCFDVLAREHDASKGRYKRELFSNLTTDQIEKVFMFFCALTYGERQFSFTKNQMDSYVENAISAIGLDAEVSAVINDFRESISIMELVGLNYEFAHRSFQEYFYAKFVVTDRKLSLKEKIGWLANQFFFDDTIDMIADMDRIYFEDDFLLPQTKILDSKLKKIDPENNPSGVLSKFFSHANARHKELDGEDCSYVTYTILEGINYLIWHQAVHKYRDKISNDSNKNFPERNLEPEMEAKILSDEFGGKLKIHHTNNAKLKKLDSSYFATKLKLNISDLHQLLKEKQRKRERGIGMLIRGEYIH